MTLRRYRQALEGMSVAGALPVDARDHELVERFGWTLTEIDEQPAERVDWHLAMAKVRDDVKRAQQERANERR